MERPCLPRGTDEEIRAQISRKGAAFSHSQGRSPIQNPERPLFWIIVILCRSSGALNENMHFEIPASTYDTIEGAGSATPLATVLY